jgi:hypothetical protein
MYIPREFLERLDELVRTDLKALRDSYFEYVLISSGAVVVGVLMEGPEVVRELWQNFRKIPEHRTPSWILLLSLLGWFLVCFGIVAEGVFEGFVSRTDGLLQTFNDTLLTDTRFRAANAEAVATSFEYQIADAGARVKMAEAQVASANAASKSAVAKVAAAQARVAEAEARAAEARSMAEAERLERIRLEALVAPRSLSLEQQRQIAEACRGFTGHRVLVSSYGLDGEGAVLGAQIITLLRTVLGNDNVLDDRASTVVVGGFELGVHVRGPDSERAFVSTLSAALSSIGGLQTFANDTPPRGGAGIGGGGAAFPQGTIYVSVMVGVKPIPILPAR